MKKLVNVTCSQCSAPLLSFREIKPGQLEMRSHGVAIRPPPTGPFFAICPKCGHQEPFDRKLMPGG